MSNLITKLVIASNSNSTWEEISLPLLSKLKEITNIEFSPKTIRTIGFDQTPKIKDIRGLQTELSYTNLGSTQLFVIANASHLSIPAQNALLKITEEPPANTQLVLLVDNPNSLLETIQSRCQIVHLDESAHLIDGEIDSTKLNQLLKIIQQGSYQDQIQLAKDWKDRAQAIDKLSILVRFLHQQPNSLSRNFQLLQLEKSIDLLGQNSNVNLILENCFFTIKNNLNK